MTRRITTRKQLREFLSVLTPEQRRQVEAQLDGVNLEEDRRRSKYNNRKTECEGILFDSAREAKWYRIYKALESVGEIRDLRLQVPFDLHVNGQVTTRYVADFTFYEPSPDRVEWLLVVADAKGVQTPTYRMKRKMMRQEYGIRIREV